MTAAAGTFLVEEIAGPEWDPGRSRREQAGWDAHAAFMDRLVEERFILLGGPVGEGDGDYALLVVAAADETAVRDRLAADPWMGSVLAIGAVRRWRIWLGHTP